MTTLATSHAIVAGEESPECNGKTNPGTAHCWHPTDGFKVDDVTQREFICCHCQARIYLPQPIMDPAKHGPYLPLYWWLRG